MHYRNRHYQMKLKTKKILAREFLIITIIIAICIISYLLTLPYNAHKLSQQNKIEKQIDLKSNQLDSFKNSENNFEPSIIINDKVLKALWDFDIKDGRHLSLTGLKDLLSNSIERRSYFKEFNNKIEAKDYNEFVDLLQTDSSRKKTEEYNFLKTQKILLMENEVDSLTILKEAISKETLSQNQKKTIFFWALTLSALVLILLRYFFYGISWSISTLRQKK